MASVTIKLERPVELHGKMVGEIELREPTGAEYIDFGEPRVLAKNKDDTLFWVETSAAIKAYLSACLVSEAGTHILPLLSMADARSIKHALFGFFDYAQAT